LSYGGTFTTRRESLIATLPVGYADGYRRAFSNRASVLVRGRRAPVVGTVCMDLCLVDVTGIPGVAVGDEVVLLGSQGGERITADELAAHAETISYEIFCGIGPRVPRVYSGGPAACVDSA
jgi:alanine racemase